LGLVREADGVGATALREMGVTAADARRKVTELLGAHVSRGAGGQSSRPGGRGRRTGRLSPGELLAMIVDEPDSDVVRALGRLGVTAASFAAALDEPAPAESSGESYEVTVA